MTDINELIEIRHKTHGDFQKVSVISGYIKDDMRKSPNWNHLSSPQREALELIAHKIARILCGNPDFKEHWDDVAGYATRIAGYLTCVD